MLPRLASTLKLSDQNCLCRFLKRSPRKVYLLLLGLTMAGLFPSHAKPLTVPEPNPENLREMAGRIEMSFRQNDVTPWFPRCIDEKQGGFLCNFDREWRASSKQPKTLVFQSRMTWVASQIVLRRPDLAPLFQKIARHGAEFLCQKMWDARDGGFFWELDGNQPPQSNDQEKHLYGNSFAIYALASAGAALKEQSCIDRAAEAFRWLEGHAHDKANGGYYEALYRDGHPMLTAPASSPDKVRDAIWAPLGCKSMNTHIHLLESFTELYRVWPDPLLRMRLEELLGIVGDRVYVEPGMLSVFFTSEWKPLPTTMSYGHDVETAYLMVEASTLLGRPDDPVVWKRARSLVDQSLRYGWDAKNGGFYDNGNALEGPLGSHDKTWWTQAEGLNALLLMHERFGSETRIYWERFLREWQFIHRAFIDPKFGGWYAYTVEDGSHFKPTGYKGDPWKAAYHTGRAMMNVVDRLNHLAQESGKKP